MPRNQHTITRFKGVMSAESVTNIPPDWAIDALNVYGDAGGWLSQLQQPTVLVDWSQTGMKTTNKAPVLGMGVLYQTPFNPRLVLQQGQYLMYVDGPPYSSPALYLNGYIAGTSPQRADFALCNGNLFFSNQYDSGYFLPASSSGKLNTRHAWGIAQPPTPITLPSTSSLGVVTVERFNGVVTVQFSLPHGAKTGGIVVVDNLGGSGAWDSSYAGTFTITSILSPNSLTYSQPTLPNTGPFTRTTVPNGLTTTQGGYQYGVCWGNSSTGHWSTLSPLTPSTGNITGSCPTILSPSPSDEQVNQVAWFRNLDGGGQWLLLTTQNLTTSGPLVNQAIYTDTTSDASLLTSGQTAPYDNGVCPNGKYLCVWLDRVLCCGIANDPFTVRYTGYDSINFGNPQMSWCNFNGIKLGQGEAVPCGMGPLRYGGMVFFATNGLMYIYRGTLNDITVSSPTSLSFYAELLPYKIGLYSHHSIQSTPAGLVWLDDGLNLRVYENSGFYPPRSLAPQLAGLLRRITPGSQDKVESSYINYLQRDWYVLSFPTDGSLTNNMTVLVDVSLDQNRITGMWPTSYAISAAAWVEYADNSKHLLTAMPTILGTETPSLAGYLTEIPLVDNIRQGLSWPQPTPPNPPMPGAFWSGGYFGLHDEQGEDEYSFMKMFRFLRYSGTAAPGDLAIYAAVVNDEFPFDSPSPIQCKQDFQEALAAVNNKGRAMSVTIRFPDSAAVPLTLTSLLAAWVITSQR